MLKTVSVLYLLTSFLCGCATWSKHGVLPENNGKFRIAVAPFQSPLKIKKLKLIQTVPKDFHPADEEILAQIQFRKIKEELSLSLEGKLNETGKFEIVPDTELAKAMTELNLSSPTERLTHDELARIGKKLNVPAVLGVTIGGYGKVKTKWLFYIFGSGALEAIAQGLAAAALTSNPWVIAGVVGEEVLQESTVWGGGIYFFDRIFTPVILDANLISVFDRKSVWKDMPIATISFKALKKLPKEERKRKEVRLRLASEKALKKLAKVLDAAAKRNLKGKEGAHGH